MTPSTTSAMSTAARARQLTDRRITTVRGDVGRDGLGLSSDDREVLASCDVVIHSAAAVSFDSPLDSAVEINLLGRPASPPCSVSAGRRRISLPCRRVTWPATVAATPPRTSFRRDRSTSV